MTWNEIKERLKSPVVVIQIITIVGGVVVAFVPSIADGWKIVLGMVIAVYNVFAGINNPANKEGF